MAEGYRTFNWYILFREYIADSFGHLYRAAEFDPDGFTRSVFLRILDAPHLPAPAIIAAFPAARVIADELASANVASGANFVEDDGVPALVYDYAPAQPLGRIIHRARVEGFPIPTENALLIAERLSQALTAGLTFERHGAPLVHGLLHPDLIMITTDGEPVLSGFGVADASLDLLDHTDAHDNVRRYLAPEVLLNRTPSKRGDVYSLGALLVELLTGEALPNDPDQRMSALHQVQLAYDERPLPEDISSMLQRAIAPDPQDRFSSAVEFKKELDRLLYGGAYSPTTFNLALFLDRLFRPEIDAEERQRTIDESIDVTPYLQHRSRSNATEEILSPPPPRHHTGLWIGVSAIIVAAAITFGSWLAFGDRPSPQPPPPATPTAAQLAERQLQQERYLQQLVEELVQQKMAEREDEIRQQLREYQSRIEELQRRLREAEQRSSGVTAQEDEVLQQ